MGKSLSPNLPKLLKKAALTSEKDSGSLPIVGEAEFSYKSILTPRPNRLVMSQPLNDEPRPIESG